MMITTSTHADSPEPIFPFGARGLRVQGVNIDQARGGKIVVSCAGWDCHYTLQPGRRSGILDLHRTSTGDDGSPVHERLFAIRRGDLLTITLSVGEAHLESVVGLLRPLRIGWLYHRRIAVVRGLTPGSEQDVEALLSRCRRRRVEIDEGAVEERVVVPEHLDILREWPDCTFTLHATGRKSMGRLIGVGFKRHGLTPALHWIRAKDLDAGMRHVGEDLVADLRRVAVSDAEFDEAMRATRGGRG